MSSAAKKKFVSISEINSNSAPPIEATDFNEKIFDQIKTEVFQTFDLANIRIEILRLIKGLEEKTKVGSTEIIQGLMVQFILNGISRKLSESGFSLEINKTEVPFTEFLFGVRTYVVKQKAQGSEPSVTPSANASKIIVRCFSTDYINSLIYIAKTDNLNKVKICSKFMISDKRLALICNPAFIDAFESSKADGDVFLCFSSAQIQRSMRKSKDRKEADYKDIFMSQFAKLTTYHKECRGITRERAEKIWNENPFPTFESPDFQSVMKVTSTTIAVLLS